MTESISGRPHIPVNPQQETKETKETKETAPVETSSPGFDAKNSVSFKASGPDTRPPSDTEKPPTLPNPDSKIAPTKEELNQLKEDGQNLRTRAKLHSSLKTLQENPSATHTGDSQKTSQKIQAFPVTYEQLPLLDKKAQTEVSQLADKLHDIVASEELDPEKIQTILLQIRNKLQNTSTKYAELQIQEKSTEKPAAENTTKDGSNKVANDKDAEGRIGETAIQTAAEKRKDKKLKRANNLEEKFEEREQNITDRQEKKANAIAERQTSRNAKRQALIDDVRTRNPKRADRMQKRLDKKMQNQADRADNVKDRQSDRADNRSDRQSDRLDKLRDWNPDRTERVRERQEEKNDRIEKRQDKRLDNLQDRTDKIREKNPERAEKIEKRIDKIKNNQAERNETREEKQTKRLDNIREKQENKKAEAQRKTDEANAALAVILPQINTLSETANNKNASPEQVVQAVQVAQTGLSQIEMLKLLQKLQQSEEYEGDLQAAIDALESGDTQPATAIFSTLPPELTQPTHETYDDFIIRISDVPGKVADAQSLAADSRELIQRNTRI